MENYLIPFPIKGSFDLSNKTLIRFLQYLNSQKEY